MHVVRDVLFVVGGLITCAATARADDPEARPWVAGVTPEQKDAAQHHLDAGNRWFVDHDYGKAIDEYQQAVELWEHPAIRFNMVRAQIRLKQYVAASKNLELALRFGSAPFDEAIYDEALNDQVLLASLTGQLDVRCTQPGVQLVLDGKPLLTCPGDARQSVETGHHQIVGRKDGFVPRALDIDVTPGKHVDVAVDLDPITRKTKVTRRWSAWVPWAPLAGGGVVAGVGLVFLTQANANLDSYTTQVNNCPSNGCAPGKADTALRDRALAENKIAIGVIGAGAVAAATGVVLLYLNRERVSYETPTLDVSPRPGGAVVTLAWRR
jgi:hypothetical protein